MSDPVRKLPTRLVFLNGSDIYKPFIEGRPIDEAHNVASYVIVADSGTATQDGTHGVTAKPFFALIASDEPYYNVAPGDDVAREMVRRWNLVADMEATDA